jgi:hypothetical protein
VSAPRRERPRPRAPVADRGEIEEALRRLEPPVFNPWPLVDGRLRVDESELTDMERLQAQLARDLDAHRPHDGLQVLRAVASCLNSRVVVPDWLLADMSARLSRVTHFEVDSLDDATAFGPPPDRTSPEGTTKEQLPTARLRSQWTHLLRWMFAPIGKLPRNKDGYQKASELTDGALSPKQVKEFLPKTRRNVPASQRYALTRLTKRATSAHDPFALTDSSRPSAK